MLYISPLRKLLKFMQRLKRMVLGIWRGTSALVSDAALQVKIGAPPVSGAAAASQTIPEAVRFRKKLLRILFIQLASGCILV